jgi:predicted metal-dependent hydrolase
MSTPDAASKAHKSCHDTPSGQVLLAIRQFNAHHWFECHETLEPLWMQAHGELRDCYQGIIQLAIALHHWRNGNYNGSQALLTSAADYLSQVSSPCQWIDVTGLIGQLQMVQQRLAQLGPDRMQQLDPALLPRIATVSV